MATLVMNCTASSTNFEKSAQVRLTYTSGNGSITISKIEGNRPDGYATNGNSGSGTNKYTITVGGRAHPFNAHNICFGGNEWKTWDDFVSFTESGLSGNTSISVYVDVCNQSMIQGRSWTGTIDAGTLPAPTNVSVNPSPSRTSINLNRNWSGDATYCQYNINDMGWINEGTSYSNGIKCDGNTVSNLTPNTSYKCQIRLGNGSSPVTTSSAVTVYTTGNKPTLSSVSAYNISYNSVSVNLNVSYDTNASFSRMLVNGTETTNMTLSGLSPNTTYSWTIQVKDNWGRISDSKTLTVTTAKPPLPSVSVPTLVNITDSTMTVSATATPGTGASITRIRFSLDDSNWHGSDSNTYTFTGLQDGTTYTVRAQATDNYDQTIWGDTAQFSTLVGSFTKVIKDGTSKKATFYIIKNGTKTKINKDRIKIIK